MKMIAIIRFSELLLRKDFVSGNRYFPALSFSVARWILNHNDKIIIRRQ